MRMHPVKVVSQVKRWDLGSFDIQPGADGFDLWHTHEGHRVSVATCGNARALSAWALDKGAALVRWDFDLQLAENP